MIKLSPELAPRTRAATKGALVPIAEIDFPTNARPTHADKVGELVKSIRLIGLQSMPTVVERDGRYMLVAGRHRVEAMRVIGKDPIPVRIADFDDIEAQLWRISENLHRNELSALERAEQIAEFARLSQEKADAARAEPQAAQVAHPEGSAGKVEADARRYEQRGDSLAARDLGITRDEVRRARTIATLPDEVKAKAADLGLDRNQSALLDAAKASPQDQISTLERRAERAPVPMTPRPSPLRNLENIGAGQLAKWIKETTPNDRLHVIDVLERAAQILRAEMGAERAA
jgi:ParB-like chromosome segregation protein Spo0J